MVFLLHQHSFAFRAARPVANQIAPPTHWARVAAHLVMLRRRKLPVVVCAHHRALISRHACMRRASFVRFVSTPRQCSEHVRGTFQPTTCLSNATPHVTHSAR
jgi:hypothetical protein